MKKILLIIIISIFHTNCKKEQEDNLYLNKTESRVDSTEIINNLFEKKLSSEPKIFLEYWSGMNYEEFQKVSNILEKKGLIEFGAPPYIYYNMGEDKLRIFPCIEDKFNKDKFIGIKLSGFSETSYEFFKNKYNFPDYIRIEPLIILEENPLYLNPNSDEFEIGKKISELTIKQAKELINENGSSEAIISSVIASPEEIIIKKDDVVIQAKLFFNTPLNTEYDNVKNIEVYKKNGYNDFHYPNNDKNSKMRVVVKRDYSEFQVRYIPRTYYDSLQIKANQYKNEIKLKEIEKEKSNIKRGQNVLNEI